MIVALAAASGEKQSKNDVEVIVQRTVHPSHHRQALPARPADWLDDPWPGTVALRGLQLAGKREIGRFRVVNRDRRQAKGSGGCGRFLRGGGEEGEEEVNITRARGIELRRSDGL